MDFKTEQENFWADEFGDSYSDRNKGEKLIESRCSLYLRALQRAKNAKSIVEFGCNRGLNLIALNRINEEFDLCGYEINKSAADKASDLGIGAIYCQTLVQKLNISDKYDICLTKGFLIHVNPDDLNIVYDNMYSITNKYILLAEYYNQTPISIEYRGHKDKLFKRDFDGDLIDRFDMKLIDYGFVYHRDPHYPLDDNTWFLLQK